MSFVEEVSADSSDVSTESQVKTSYALEEKKTVFAMYALASHSDNQDLGSALDLCIIYQDGSVDLIDGDVATKRWTADAAEAIALAQGASTESLGRVEYATVTDVEKARKGLLKGREDALAVVVASSTTDDQSALNIPLLVLTTATESSRHVRIFALPSRSKDLVTSIHPGLRHLLSYELPTSHSAAATPSDAATFSLHASSGKLQQLHQGAVTTYDLSGTTPVVLSTLTPRSQPYTSFVRVSPALLMASDTSLCAIYDTKYTSLQGQLPLISEPVESPGKRKRAEPESTALDFVTFFADLSLAVAISKNTLIGIQVNPSAPSYKKSKSGTSLLINSLAKGFGHTEDTNGAAEATFTQWKAQVDNLVDTNIDALERFLAAELETAGSGNKSKAEKPTKRGRHNKEKHDSKRDQIKTPKTDEQESVEDEEKQIQVLANSSAPQVWDFGNISMLVQRTDRRKALYLLTKMFTWSSNASQNEPTITLAFFAPNIFKWLAVTGYLTSAFIDRALRQADASTPALKVRPGDIVRALNELDPEMHIMHEYLTWPIYIEVDEVVIALRTLIKSLDDSKPGLITELITSGAMDTASLPEAVAAGDEQGALEAAEADLQYAIAQLENGLNVRSTSLRTVFHRLHSFPPTAIISALKTHLQQNHLVFFVGLLRVELADGGWTSRYLYPIINPRVQELAEGERPADNSLNIISNLLCCGIDAVGLTGWMVPSTREKQQMIEVLLAESSAALEGAHEASEMGTWLADFERYALAIKQQEKDERKEGKVRSVDAIKRPGIEESKEVSDPILPMGLKVVKVEKMLQRNGGREQKKSNSLLHKERSMRVGKYSLDRIRV